MPRWLSSTWCCITAGRVVAVALRYAKVLRAEGLESGREKKAFVFNRRTKGIRIKKRNWGLGGGAKDAVGSATNAYLMSRGACGSSCISSMIGLFI